MSTLNVPRADIGIQISYESEPDHAQTKPPGQIVSSSVISITIPQEWSPPPPPLLDAIYNNNHRAYSMIGYISIVCAL